MEKTTQFITMVQTALLIKYANDPIDRSLARPIAAMQHLQTAYDVAGNIPAEVTGTLKILRPPSAR